MQFLSCISVFETSDSKLEVPIITEGWAVPPKPPATPQVTLEYRLSVWEQELKVRRKHFLIFFPHKKKKYLYQHERVANVGKTQTSEYNYFLLSVLAMPDSSVFFVDVLLEMAKPLLALFLINKLSLEKCLADLTLYLSVRWETPTPSPAVLCITVKIHVFQSRPALITQHKVQAETKRV